MPFSTSCGCSAVKGVFWILSKESLTCSISRLSHHHDQLCVSERFFLSHVFSSLRLFIVICYWNLSIKTTQMSVAIFSHEVQWFAQSLYANNQYLIINLHFLDSWKWNNLHRRASSRHVLVSFLAVFRARFANTWLWRWGGNLKQIVFKRARKDW